MQKSSRLRIGDILLAAKAIDDDQLQKGLALAKEQGIQLGKALVKLGVTTQEKIMYALSEQLEIPFINLQSYQADQTMLQLVEESFAREKRALPLFRIHNNLTVAMVDPLDVFTIDELLQKTGFEVEPVVCTEEELNRAIDLYFGSSGKLDEVVKFIQQEDGDSGFPNEQEILSADVSGDEAPVIRLVNMIFAQAVSEGASDIHIEPEEDLLRVRFRVDGVLSEMFTQPKSLQYAIISRVKIMSELNIAERRVPQDGRFQMRIENRDIDIRVSTMPSANGENIVMRILDKTNLIVELDDLGLSKAAYKSFKDALASPNGIILVTGPTGSGKTTTLYSALHSINSLESNVITIEDPIEYRMKIIRQSQVSAKVGMTFAMGLRAILRQDPDIIMVGEIRDAETATVAVQAALTGHLVLSTLHTNDAPGAVNRLIEMGVEPFLVSSSVSLVVAQRLVRRICTKCRTSYQAAPALIKDLRLQSSKDYTFYKGKGCRNCNQTGYKGRVAIFEVLEMNDELRVMVLERVSVVKFKNAAVKNGMKTMRQDGLLKALKGLTSVEEVVHTTRENE